MVYGIAPGLAGMTWYMVWSAGHGIVYGIALRAWQDIWYGLAGMTWYKAITWRGMGWYMVWPGGMTCIWYGLAGIAWYGLVGIAWYKY